MKIPQTLSSWYKNWRHLGIQSRNTWDSFPDLAKKVDCFKCTEGGRTVHKKEQVGVVKIISNQKQQAAHKIPETDPKQQGM